MFKNDLNLLKIWCK